MLYFIKLWSVLSSQGAVKNSCNISLNNGIKKIHYGIPRWISIELNLIARFIRLSILAIGYTFKQFNALLGIMLSK